MQAAQLTTNGAPLELREIDAPTAQGRAVIVRVQRCGVCHTDLHLHEGAFGLGGDKSLKLQQNLPLTLGHEIQGVVASTGDAVDTVTPGDAVVVYPWIGCGRCGMCKSGREHLCGRARAIGVNVDGGYADLVHVVDARYVLPIGNVDPAQAAIIMCSGLSAWSALSKVAHAFEADLPVAIIGLGGLGLMALEIARARFGKLPAVLDVDPGKLALACERGAQAFDLNDADAHKQVRGALGSLAAVVDFVGAETTSAIAGRLCGQGGHIVIVGLYGGALHTPLPLLALRGTTIQGSYTGSLEEARACLALAEQGGLDPVPTVTCGREDINGAFDRLRAGGVPGRIIIENE
ncbi:MAG: alcohol dehydrogenase catalytic domain-containing protein [Pseudomonadota bacterium]